MASRRYTTEEALRGDGGPVLQKVVREHVARVELRGGYETSATMRGIELIPAGAASPAAQPRASHNPSTDNPNSWMSPDLQKFYKHQERKQKTYKMLEENEKFATANPNSVAARKLHLDRELDLMKSELAMLDARAAKAELDRKNAAKDPWATYRLF